MAYFIGKGYGISDITDITGRPLLTFQGPGDKRPFLLSDRVAQEFDFTVAQKLTAGAMKNGRMDASTSSFIKTKLGGVLDDELDHKISLELGGSNAPANLFIQPGRTSGASAASDTIENNLAVDVVNGKISLLTAWRTLAEQKGFLLGEDSKIGTTFSITQLASTLWNIATSSVPSIKKSQLGQMDVALRAQIDADMAKLAQDPLNQKLATQIFRSNVSLVQAEIVATSTEAGGVVRGYLAAYAQSKGIDPREVMGALNANIQKIVDNSTQNPNLFGISSLTITKIVAFIQAASAGLVGVGIALAVIGIFLAGPEVVLGALSGGLLESIGAIFGVSALTGIGLTSFAVGEAFNVAAIGLNMSVKQMYDNGYLLPTQNISALKEALAVQKGLSGFLPSAVSTTPAATSTRAAGAASSGGGGSSVAVKVFTGLLTSGTLGSQPAFVPRESGLIESAAELTQDARQEAASFLAALPASIVYEVRIVNYVVAPDGTRRSGTVQRIKTGTLKNGTPKYRVLRNKFAVLDLYYNDAKPGRTKLAELIIGPVDVSAFNPTPSDLAALTGTMQGKVVTSNVGEISKVVTAQPITAVAPAAPVVAAPVAVQSGVSASGVSYNPAWADVGLSLASWNAFTPAQRDKVIPTDGQTGRVITGPAAPVPVAAPVVATAPPTAPTNPPVGTFDFTSARIASGYVYNLPTGAGGYYSGPLEGAPAVPMGKLYEAKGLGPASTYTGNATQIARLDQLI